MEKIKTIGDLINNEEFVQQIVEDITEIPEDTEVSYEVWASGYDFNDEITDTNTFMKDFKDPDEAIEYAKQLTLADIIEQDAKDRGDEKIKELDTEIAYISVEVETVIEDEDDSTMNIGTIYKRDLCINNRYSSEEDILEPEDEYGEVVPVTSKDYKLLEDGSLEIGRDILKNFNKNDIVQIWFTDENDCKSILTYKIISKTTANKFICEFIY